MRVLQPRDRALHVGRVKCRVTLNDEQQRTVKAWTEAFNEQIVDASRGLQSGEIAVAGRTKLETKGWSREIERNTIVEHRWWFLEELHHGRKQLIRSDFTPRLAVLPRNGLCTSPRAISAPLPR